MAEDFDVEAMLEAPFKEHQDNNHKDDDRIKSSHKERRRDRDHKRRSPDRSRDRRRRSRSSSRDRRREKRRSRSKDRQRRRSPDRSHRDRDRNRDRDRYRSERRRGGHRSRSRSPASRGELLPEERDQRTIFVMQLNARVVNKDLEDFFSVVGKVREARLIMDNKTRRHKGIAYIEFHEINSVGLALALNGQKICGSPVIIQPTQAEKNRAAASAAALQRGVATGPMRLYVGSLHFNINEDMLRGIFEPFGRIDRIELMRDPENHRSKGYGFITFFDAEDAKKALDQLNGFELAGRPMKVNHVTERPDMNSYQGPSLLDSDETERGGIELGTTGRLQLMAKLAEGTDIQLPKAVVNALQMGQAVSSMPHNIAQTASIAAHAAASNGGISTLATQCFMLSNLFDPSTETSINWPEEIKNDVLDECNKSGGALHIYVDQQSQGNVYVKCPTVEAAQGCVSSLHGRWFSGRMVTAAYVPVSHYHNLFSEAALATNPL